jgi:hypothetical protein
MAGNFGSGSGTELNVNGVLLEKYLELIVKSAETFKEKEHETFQLYAYLLKSLITDDDRVAGIDKAMKACREDMDKNHKTWDDGTRSFMESFCIYHECMRFLDHTLKITKRDVEINADQTDKDMPEDLGSLDIAYPVPVATDMVKVAQQETIQEDIIDLDATDSSVVPGAGDAEDSFFEGE